MTVSSGLVNACTSHNRPETYNVQLMIDILAETPEALDLAAEFLKTHAALRRASEVPTGTPAAPFVPAAPIAPTATAAASSTPSPILAPAVAPEAPPAPSNVLPFVQPAPMSAPSVATAGTSASPIAPPAPISNGATASPGASVAPLADEYDSAGVPWDARIHQKGKSVKKDKTWKLQKGIADAVVSAVMQELAARIRKTPAAPPAPETPVAAGAVAPVTLPPVPILGTPQAPLAPPAPGQVAAPPAPAAQAETVAPALDPYRALIRKVTDARTAKRCTAEEVTACAAAAGVPSLQALNAMPHLISTVEAHIDALLATR